MNEPLSFVRSVTRGRARLRHASLAGISASDAAGLEDMISGLDGITSVTVNPRVGSLLVTWDETKTDAATLLAAARLFLADADDGAECAGECEAPAPAAAALPKLARDAGGLAQSAAARTLDLLAPVVAPDVRSGGRSRRVTQNRLMLAGYALSLAALAVRGTAVHIAFGTAFTGLLAVHLYQHRRVL